MLKQRKVPMRMCVVTHERCEKKNLIRIVQTADGIIVDETGKVNGHGVYLKKDIEVITRAQKNKLLNKIFATEVADDVFESAKELVVNEGK